jgi:hypothetical protein
MMMQHEGVPDRSRWDRVLDTTEIGLWLLLLGTGFIVALEAMRQQDAVISVPMTVDPTEFIEAERLHVRGVAHGVRLWLQPTTLFAPGSWSSDGHLFAMHGGLGAWVEFELPIVEAGAHRLELYLTRARDYGVVQVLVDGEALGEPIDLWEARGVLPSGPIELGPRELFPDSVLRLEVVGTNDRSANPHYQFGIDGVKITRIP